MSEKINIVQLYKMCAEIADEINKDSSNGKDVPEKVLEPLTETFEKVIDFIKVYLIMAQDAFYGAMLSGMDTAIDYTVRSAVDVDVSNNNIFKLTFNPLFAYKYSFPELVGLVVGEILKIAYAHPSTYAEINSENDERKHTLLEKGSSASISNMIQNDIRLDSGSTGHGLRLPKDAYTVSKLNEDLSITPQRNQSLEYYFKVLQKFSKNNNNNNDNQSSGQTGMQGGKCQNQSQSLPMSGNGQPNDSDSDQSSPVNGNSQQNQQSKQGSENKVATPSNNNGKESHRWESQVKSSDETKEACKSFVDSAFKNLNDRQRGFMPAGLVEQIKALLAPPEIPWQKILRNMVGAIPIPYRKTRTRLNRRQPQRSDLSGRLPKRIVNIVVCFDTSGSMSDACLRYCFNEVLNILKTYQGASITIIECDAEVGDVYTCSSMKEFKTKVAKGVSGRGGTSFVPAIELINGTPEYKKKFPKYAGKFRNALMVYFTDGYGDYEIPKPKTYRNLWVVLDDEKNLSVKNPYGDVKSLNSDAAYKKLKKAGAL